MLFRSIGKTDAAAAAAVLWPLDVKSQLIGKDSDAGKIEGRRRRGRSEERRVGKDYPLQYLLEKTPESPLDCKEIKPVNPKGNQS